MPFAGSLWHKVRYRCELSDNPNLVPHAGMPGPVQYQDPAIMSLSKMAPPPQYQPQHQVFPSATTVPGMKTLADIEAEMMFGPPRPQLVDRGGGEVGHINPALHNLNYPGMRDRQHQHHQPQRQQQPQHLQQQQQQQFRHSPGLSNQQQLQQGELFCRKHTADCSR